MLPSSFRKIPRKENEEKKLGRKKRKRPKKPKMNLEKVD